MAAVPLPSKVPTPTSPSKENGPVQFAKQTVALPPTWETSTETTSISTVYGLMESMVTNVDTLQTVEVPVLVTQALMEAPYLK